MPDKPNTSTVISGPVTAAHLRASIKRRYPHPEFGSVFEVAQATGFAAHRHLDAIVMDTWPSRGLSIIGIEVKCSLHDWRRERKNPEKAEQLARFCDYFYIAAPAGLIPVSELPSAWGLLELDPNTAELFQKVGASKTPAEGVTKEFLAAIMRAANRPIDPEGLDFLLAARLAQLNTNFQDRVAREAARNSERATEDAKSSRKLMEMLGEGVGAKDVLKGNYIHESSSP